MCYQSVVKWATDDLQWISIVFIYSITIHEIDVIDCQNREVVLKVLNFFSIDSRQQQILLFSNLNILVQKLTKLTIQSIIKCSCVCLFVPIIFSRCKCAKSK